jgi:septum formation protein
MKLPPVILASSSPRRAELLRKLVAEFTVIHSDAVELHNEQLTAMEISQLNAYRKARAVAKKFPDALVIGADTLVYLGTTLFGKPASLEEAQRMLKQLRGQTHQVVTGVCLLQLRGHHQKLFAESTAVKFRTLGTRAIRDYLALIQPLDKAGAYAIQDHGDKIVENISGSLSNVIGLPMERLQEELEAWSSGG